MAKYCTIKIMNPNFMVAPWHKTMIPKCVDPHALALGHHKFIIQEHIMSLVTACTTGIMHLWLSWSPQIHYPFTYIFRGQSLQHKNCMLCTFWHSYSVKTCFWNKDSHGYLTFLVQSPWTHHQITHHKWHTLKSHGVAMKPWYQVSCLTVILRHMGDAAVVSCPPQ